jgi:hypothetical protein
MSDPDRKLREEHLREKRIPVGTGIRMALKVF